MPGRPILAHLVVLLCVVFSGFLLYPYIEERCIDAWDERQVRIAREENAREEEIHRQVDFIVGFYVGPSASVALFRNGTTLNLAKVDGNAVYRAAMERRIARADDVKAWYDQNWPLPDEGGRFGSCTTEELEQVFVPTLRTLKRRSEETLGRSIEHVHFATPWVAEYDQPGYDKTDAFLVAGRRLGLKRGFIYDRASKIIMPTHLNEANAVLASTGRKLCQECFCTEDLWQQWSGRGSNIFYINLSSKSLYLSRQPAGCVFEAYWVRSLHLHTAFGLDQLQAEDSTQFWTGVKTQVLSHIVPWYRDSKYKATTILLAGEATSDAGFLTMGQSIRQELLTLRGNTSFDVSNGYHYQYVQGLDPVELVMAEDGVYDAAKGAAVMMRTDFWGYCDGTDEDETRLACRDHYEENGVEWTEWSQFYQSAIY